MKNYFATLLILIFMVVPWSGYSINNTTNLREIPVHKETVNKPDFFMLPFCYYHKTTKLTISPDGSTTYETPTTLICTVIVIP
jgi:hypothetical protein